MPLVGHQLAAARNFSIIISSTEVMLKYSRINVNSLTHVDLTVKYSTPSKELYWSPITYCTVCATASSA